MVCHVSSKTVSVKGVEYNADLQKQSLRMQPLILSIKLGAEITSANQQKRLKNYQSCSSSM